LPTKLTWVLGALVALCALVWTEVEPRPVHALSNCDVSDYSNDAEELEFLRLLNAYRATTGARALTVAADLNRASTWMATDLGSRSALAHQDSLGRTPWVRMPDCGYSIPGGENLAAGLAYASASGALDAWKRSPSHNTVMLAADFTEIGIARVYSEGSRYGYYWVTNFGYGGTANAATAATATPVPPTPAPPQPPVMAAPPKPAAPPPPPPTATPEPAYLAMNGGAALVTWNGPAVSPAVAFGAVAQSLKVVYAYDPWTDTWLRWSPTMDPKLQTLMKVETGARYWVIADRPVTLPLR